MTDAKTKPPLLKVYRALHRKWGPQHWWPARTKFEMMTGAILTQNTAWTNVERVIRNLKKAKALSPGAMNRMTRARLAELIRPSGTFHVKARRLKSFVTWMKKTHGGSVRRMLGTDTAKLRRELLEINGIGPETADSILLYAGNRPVFVVDTYTRRILQRHGWLSGSESYDDVAQRFDQSCQTVPMKNRARLYNEYHALLVQLAKQHCRSKPSCDHCPLKRWLPPGGALTPEIANRTHAPRRLAKSRSQANAGIE